MGIEELTDEELLQRSQTGDENAFTCLYRRRQAGVYRFALRMSGSAAMAEDVTQEVFLALLREGRRYSSKRGSVAAYLLGIARNQVLRRLERDGPQAAETASREPVSGAKGPLDELAQGESIQAIRSAVLGLPAHYREVVALCDLEEMRYEDAAAVLGCAVGTVRSRLHRAHGLLAERLCQRGVDYEQSGFSRV
jgi:RNA polymerase sigma-70 factor (ECF subfamily)